LSDSILIPGARYHVGPAVEGKFCRVCGAPVRRVSAKSPEVDEVFYRCTAATCGVEDY